MNYQITAQDDFYFPLIGSSSVSVSDSMTNDQLSEAYNKIKIEAKNLYPYSFLNESIYARKNFQAKLSVEKYQEWGSWITQLASSRKTTGALGIESTIQANQDLIMAAAVVAATAGAASLAVPSVGAAASAVGSSAGGIGAISVNAAELATMATATLEGSVKKEIENILNPKKNNDEVLSAQEISQLEPNQDSIITKNIPLIAGAGLLAVLLFI